MQKFLTSYLAIIILFQGMFGNTNILFEINELAEDYQIHKEQYHDSFTTFLSKHFGDLKKNHQQQHEEEHRQHQHPQSDFNANFQTDFVPQISTINLHNCMVKEKRNTLFFYKNLFSNFEKQKIFQPPQNT